MLSYRHAYHAGNHADVFKHLVLTLLMQSLLKKEKPFFILDTHAGAGRYHLGSEMARKNREFASGIERLWEVANPPEAIGQYLDAVRTTNPGRELRWYPGSPRIFRHFSDHKTVWCCRSSTPTKPGRFPVSLPVIDRSGSRRLTVIKR